MSLNHLPIRSNYLYFVNQESRKAFQSHISNDYAEIIKRVLFAIIGIFIIQVSRFTRLLIVLFVNVLNFKSCLISMAVPPSCFGAGLSIEASHFQREN